ncbi:MAG: hypothetical protein DHS80DRAFT_25062 [Piptocephalis tieghemiana]|nr:MAG: hypothetical protein DHS80DRAFT_25062 [Piptocephalis tieghemiana]
MDNANKRAKSDDTPGSTSRFRKQDTDDLNISFEGVKEWWTPIEMFDAPTFFYLRNEDVPTNEEGGEYTREERTLISHLNKIRINEGVVTGTQESNTDSMVNYVLTKLEFNEYPCSLRLQQLIQFYYGDRSITSVPEFCIEHGIDTVLIDEDKHFKNVRQGTQWGEYQIAGEMLAIACSNHDKQYSHGLEIRSYETVHAMRVIGARFTFYKSIVSKKYIDSVNEGTPSEKMVIMRYPDNYDKDPAFSHWDFFKPTERRKIIEALFQIKHYIDHL